MTFRVLLREQADGRFRATVLDLPACVAEGSTRDAALEAARSAIIELMHGEIVEIDVPLTERVPRAGRFKNDPTYDEFLERIAEYRRTLNHESETA